MKVLGHPRLARRKCKALHRTIRILELYQSSTSTETAHTACTNHSHDPFLQDAAQVRYLRPRTSRKGLRSRLVNDHWLQTKLQFETVWLAEATGCQSLPRALVLASARPKCFRPHPQLGSRSAHRKLFPAAQVLRRASGLDLLELGGGAGTASSAVLRHRMPLRVPTVSVWGF